MGRERDRERERETGRERDGERSISGIPNIYTADRNS